MDIADKQLAEMRKVMIQAITDQRTNYGSIAEGAYIMGAIWGAIDYMIEQRGRRATYNIIQGFADGIADSILKRDA